MDVIHLLVEKGDGDTIIRVLRAFADESEAERALELVKGLSFSPKTEIICVSFASKTLRY